MIVVACGICKRTFNQRSALSRHIKEGSVWFQQIFCLHKLIFRTASPDPTRLHLRTYLCQSWRFLEGDWFLSRVYVFLQCVSEPPRGRVSAELSKPVERKGAMCVVLV